MLEAGWPGEGVVFGMPFDQYLAAGGLSFSTAKRVLVSPMEYWAHSPMNPNRPEPEPSPAKILGAAYHARLLEGADEFERRFCLRFDPSDHPGALGTMADLRAALADYGLKASSKDDAIAKLQQAGDRRPILAVLEAEYERMTAGRQPLSRSEWAGVEMAARMIESHPHLSPLFRSGYSEVSIFWREPTTGVPMKARLDKLHLRSVVDLKSFQPRSRGFDREVAYAIASMRYYLQAAIYLDAVQAARRMWRERSGAFVVASGASHPSAEWMDRWAEETSSPKFVFVFQAKGAAPVARGYVLPRRLIMSIGETQYVEACRSVKQAYDVFGADPWIDVSPIRELDDSEFPAFVGD